MAYAEVVGAYGRSYKTLAEAKQDWMEGLDFRMTTGSYINKEDADKYGVNVTVRYGKNGEKIGTLRK